MNTPNPEAIYNALVKAGAIPELLERIQSSTPIDQMWLSNVVGYLQDRMGSLVPIVRTRIKHQIFEPLSSFLSDETIIKDADKCIWDLPECAGTKCFAYGTTFQSWNIRKGIELDDVLLDLAINVDNCPSIAQICAFLYQTKDESASISPLAAHDFNWFFTKRKNEPFCIQVVARSKQTWEIKGLSPEEMYKKEMRAGGRIFTIV